MQVRMTPTAVFDLDKVLLRGDASTLFLHGRLRQAPRRAVLLLPAAPLLAGLAAVPQTRALSARIMTRLAVGGRPESDVAAVASAYRTALKRHPEAAVGEAVAAVREHQADGERVVIATGCEETLARGFLEAIGLGDLAVVDAGQRRRAGGGAGGAGAGPPTADVDLAVSWQPAGRRRAVLDSVRA
jgi:phosphatidylglycerophosphatase C